jgi:P27 family predicted phage terminase small subunit
MAGNANSGRSALPAALHLINGNPSKKSASELATSTTKPVVAPLEPPTCPDFLTGAAKIEWKRIVDDLLVMGVLSRIDRAMLAVYCQAWADWKMAREKLAAKAHGAAYEDMTPSGYKQMSVWLQIANRAEERMRVAGASFGLNPSARSSMNVQAPQGKQLDLLPNDQKEAADRFFRGAGT